jgi:hypothetical protein
VGAASPSGKKSNALVVVAVLGAALLFVLAVLTPLALYGVRKYLTNAKSAEARSVAVELANGIARCSASGTLPESTRPVPAALALVNGTKFASKPGDWSDPAFRCAGFERTAPQYFQYQWQRLDARHGVVAARADFDQDGAADHGFEVAVSCAGTACSAAVTASDVSTAAASPAARSATGAAAADDLPIGVIAVVGVAMLVATAGSIWTLVLAFSESVLWGVAVLLVPCASLVFSIKFWHQARTPFLLQLGALLSIVFAGAFGAIASAGRSAKAAAPRTATATDSADTALPGPAPPPPASEPEPTPAPKLDGASVRAIDVLAEAQLRATKWDASAELVSIEIFGIGGGKVSTPDGGSVFATYRRKAGTSRSKSDQLVVSYDQQGLREQESRSSVPLPTLFEPHCPPERVAEIAEGFSTTPGRLNLKYTKDLARDRVVWVASVAGSKQPPRTFDGQSCTILVR